MNASFEEKSVWIQLVSKLVVLGGYFVIAISLLASGVTAMPAYVALFTAAVGLMIVVLVAGHVAVAIASRPDGRDEHDRLIGWRAESNSSWVLGAGVLVAVTGLVLSVESVWIANGLLFALFLSEVVKYVLQLVYYRRGI